MSKKDNGPGDVSASHGTGDHSPSSSGANLPPNEPPAKDAIWDACPEARDAEAKRKEWYETSRAAKKQDAATRLGFTQDQDGWWEKQCPHCGGKVVLRFKNRSNDIYADSAIEDDDPNPVFCDAIPAINQWLKDGGFTS